MNKDTVELEFESSKPFKLVDFPESQKDNFSEYDSLELKYAKAWEYLEQNDLLKLIKNKAYATPEAAALSVVFFANSHINSKKLKYTMMKVFDCQDMPTKLQKEFFDACEKFNNDICVEWKVWTNKEKHPVDIWLMENGAEDGEEVIIKHYW